MQASDGHCKAFCVFFFLNQVGFITQIGGCLHCQGFGSTRKVTGSLGRVLSPEEPAQTSYLQKPPLTTMRGAAEGRGSRAGLLQTLGPGLVRKGRCTEEQWDSGSILKVKPKDLPVDWMWMGGNDRSQKCVA